MWCKYFLLKIPTDLIFLTPKILKMCYPILVTLIKIQPHIYSHSSREIATPSSGMYPLAYYQEVSPEQATVFLRHKGYVLR